MNTSRRHLLQWALSASGSAPAFAWATGLGWPDRAPDQTLDQALDQAPDLQGSRLLPSQFVHDRVFLTPSGTAGGTRIFTDTGGGLNMISPQARQRWALPEVRRLAGGPEAEMPLVPMPEVWREAGIPVGSPDDPVQGALLAVPPQWQMPGVDGFLGSRWFAGGIWEIDHASRSLRRWSACPDVQAMRRVPLAFKDGGVRGAAFPGLDVRVDGEWLHMLLDTGATSVLGPEGGAAFGLPEGTAVGTGFVAASTFQQWRRRHPDWRVLERGERFGARDVPMIEVPELEVGGLSAGPVWFALRPDPAIQGGMSSMMARPIQAALGGSALRHFRWVLDYPAGMAHVARVPV